ncbi:hypothetical protein BBK82_25470 [Lentzea guizhouensis]|uniref:Erythromycin biosynthesis protein CIII-like C-terminal domain-containing protein n=1 Tax=Lentzea guizhouensis TaxID=1586287 RepID=A0A1B2HZ85_9PSEU|nr:hypothetical protein BBK82_25470 [Lentzea guizhouensis]
MLVASLPFAGHVGVMAAVSNELVRRGHDVVAYTGAKYHHRFVGARWLPWTDAPDFDDAALARTFPRVGNLKGMRSNLANFADVLVGTAPGQVRDVLREDFDLVVTEHLAFGAGMAAELRGVPWATVSLTPLTLPSRDLPPFGLPLMPAATGLERLRDRVLRPVVESVAPRATDPLFDRARKQVGLDPRRRAFEASYSKDLLLAQAVPGLEYVRSDLPAHVHFVGRLIDPPKPMALPDWWPDLDGRTVVHVTQGTLETGADDLVRPAIEALADLDVLVVATGPGLAGVPGNVRTAPFIPHDLLLPRTDLMITNGGWGGVLAAVEAGVPIVVVPGSLDKPEVARRVAWSGVGVRTRPVHLRKAVEEVLGEPRYRERARELGSGIKAAGGAARAADLVEALMRR